MRRLYDLFAACAGISTDSRDVSAGSMFFALRGARFDGNAHAAEALEKGAAWAVVDDPRVALTEQYLVVENSLLALQQLAAHHRRELGIPILAITGSNGKTTTKELIARVLSCQFRVAVTRGNLNNHIGVPLTLLSIGRDVEVGVVEMGANARGEIAALCEIAAPDFGLITNVGRAHLQGFGGVYGVRAGKGELYDYLAAHGGTAFVPSEDPILMQMASERAGLKSVIYSVSEASGMRSRLEGDYNLANIAAAVAVGRYFEVADEFIVSAIESYVPDNHRSQRVATTRNTLIIDCYNANPSSMRVAIENLAADRSGLPKTAILGDMHELGSYSEAEHQAVFQLLTKSGIEDVYLVGGQFGEAARSRSDVSFRTFGDTGELRRFLEANPMSNRLVLLKASRGVALEKVVDLL